ncbi:Homeodomain-like [Phytophthora cactorum]|nr:Homeodomain-like [Phytophthora cactorum]
MWMCEIGGETATNMRLHCAYVNEVGLKNASPKTLLPMMNKSNPESGLTTEHLKSHLQKYRINYQRSSQEFQEICDREVKRDRKRRRHEERRSNVGSGHCDSYSEPEVDGYSGGRPFFHNRELVDAASIASRSAEYLPTRQTPVTVPVSSDMPELTDAQWRTFSMLMSAPPLDDTLSVQILPEAPPSQTQVQDSLQLQMYQAMQAQMSFHRQMLTRKLELSNNLSQRDGLKIWRASMGQYATNTPASTGIPPLAATNESIRDPTTIGSILSFASDFDKRLASFAGSCPLEDQIPDASCKTDSVGVDINRWEPFSVGLDDDELFEFLNA